MIPFSKAANIEKTLGLLQTFSNEENGDKVWICAKDDLPISFILSSE